MREHSIPEAARPCRQYCCIRSAGQRVNARGNRIRTLCTRSAGRTVNSCIPLATIASLSAAIAAGSNRRLEAWREVPLEGNHQRSMGTLEGVYREYIGIHSVL